MTIKNEITLQDTVDFLNYMLKADSFVTNALFSMRFPCNKEIRFSPTIQVGLLNNIAPVVGMIGVLNGLFGTDEDGWGKIAANYEGHTISEFVLLDRKNEGTLDHHANT